jgi:hypothetical protein
MSDKKSHPSDGLFTIECNTCKSVFKAEDKACACGNVEGDLKLDIDQMLNRIYDLHAAGKQSASIDVVFDVYWNLYKRFDIMNEILSKTDVSKLDGGLLVSFLAQTFKYIDQVPAHIDFCDRAAARMKDMGYDDKRIHDLVDRYRETGDYWKKMEGIPAWLSGPKPD